MRLTHLELVEVSQGGEAPVHVLHHRHQDELLREDVHVARPVLHVGVRRLRDSQRMGHGRTESRRGVQRQQITGGEAEKTK